MSILKLVAVFALLISTINSFASSNEPDNRAPLEHYRDSTKACLLVCKISFKMAQFSAELSTAQNESTDYESCIQSEKDKANWSFNEVMQTIKNNDAKEAFKSHHVAVISALMGIKPGMDERKISYEQRQQALENKVTESWVRFEIEQ